MRELSLEKSIKACEVAKNIWRLCIFAQFSYESKTVLKIKSIKKKLNKANVAVLTFEVRSAGSKTLIFSITP